jgi:acetoin utilization protein AcuB
MKVLGVRHLPVVDDGRLVGLLSERELAVGEALGRDGSRHAVAEVMAADPFTCGPQAHLHAVATEMADHRYGSAVVVEREHPTTVLGVFTTVDALRALALYSGHDD